MLSADNQQGRLSYMSKNIHPQYIVGFVDGEGSFHVAIYKDPRMKTGIKFIPEFHISQRLSSKQVLITIRGYFQCGYIKENHARKDKDDTYVYVVRNKEDLLTKIIPFFQKNSFRTEKQRDFELFSQIVILMKEGKHRTMVGAKKILTLAYKMNKQGRYRKKKYILT